MPLCFGCEREYPESQLGGEPKPGLMFHSCHRSENLILDQETGNPVACSLVYGVPKDGIQPTPSPPQNTAPISVPGKEVKPVIGFGIIRFRK